MPATRAFALLALVAVAFGDPVRPSAQGRDPEAGHAAFGAKGCAACHLAEGAGGAGPPLETLRRPQGEWELAGRLWNHLPRMVAALSAGGGEWPAISAAEMADLMIYLRAVAARDPVPDLARGQVVLMRKGCLRCHSLRGEGGGVEPDLAEKRQDYESASVWAATMWMHTPRMAAMGERRGVPYPRFSGAEMAHLVAWLRHVSGMAR